MKNLIKLTFLNILIFLSLSSTSQVEFIHSPEYNKMTSTSYEFKIDSSYTMDEIYKSSVLLIDYFKVTLVKSDIESNNILITLNENNSMNRRIMSRLFTMLNISEITSDGKNLSIEEFMDKYIYIE